MKTAKACFTSTSLRACAKNAQGTFTVETRAKGIAEKRPIHLLDQPKFPVLTRPNVSIIRLAQYPTTSDRQRIPKASIGRQPLGQDAVHGERVQAAFALSSSAASEGAASLPG